MPQDQADTAYKRRVNQAGGTIRGAIARLASGDPGGRRPMGKKFSRMGQKSQKEMRQIAAMRKSGAVKTSEGQKHLQDRINVLIARRRRARAKRAERRAS